MRLKVIVVAVIALAVTGVALASGIDHGRRLSGPFCIDKNSGIVHAIAAVDKCSSSQIRKPGVAVQGPAGPKGDTGPIGATGPAGPPGANGTNGTTPTFNTRSLCLVPTSYGGKNGASWSKTSTGASGVVDTSNTKYYVLNRACTDSDKGGVPLVVLTP